MLCMLIRFEPRTSSPATRDLPSSAEKQRKKVQKGKETRLTFVSVCGVNLINVRLCNAFHQPENSFEPHATAPPFMLDAETSEAQFFIIAKRRALFN